MNIVSKFIEKRRIRKNNEKILKEKQDVLSLDILCKLQTIDFMKIKKQKHGYSYKDIEVKWIRETDGTIEGTSEYFKLRKGEDIIESDNNEKIYEFFKSKYKKVKKTKE